MLAVEYVDLSEHVVLPNASVGFVLAQPFVPLVEVEPFRSADEAVSAVLDQIRETLRISKSAPHGLGQTHFTIFPEYSIPVVQGVELIEQEMAAADWPCGSVVIGGLQGLDRTAYSELVNRDGSHVSSANAGAKVEVGQWVNCLVTWTKSADGAIRRWCQPKLSPAWGEGGVYQEMFHGRSVYVFEGRRADGSAYRFASVVCYDWMATIDQRKTAEWILSDLNDRAQDGGELPLSWLFVVQRNKKPSHSDFLRPIEFFFNQANCSRVGRAAAAVVFVNVAGRERTGESSGFGATSLVYSHHARFGRQPCPMTFANGGPTFRDGNPALADYPDVFFRERGSCILSFAQINPATLEAGPGGRVLPIERAYVFPTNGVAEPRAPGHGVAACVKWVNDRLDREAGVAGKVDHPQLQAVAAECCKAQVKVIRELRPQDLTKILEIAVARKKPKDDEPLPDLPPADDWEEREALALSHVVCTLSILGIGVPVTVGVPGGHGRAVLSGADLRVLAMRGTSHQACLQHAQLHHGGWSGRTLLVSRDEEGLPWDPAFAPITSARIKKDPNVDPNITDPGRNRIQIGYSQLLNAYVRAQSAEELLGGISAIVTA